MQIPEILKDRRVIIGAGVAAVVLVAIGVYRATRRKKPELTLHKNPSPTPAPRALTNSVTNSQETPGSTEIPFPQKTFAGPEANA